MSCASQLRRLSQSHAKKPAVHEFMLKLPHPSSQHLSPQRRQEPSHGLQKKAAPSAIFHVAVLLRLLWGQVDTGQNPASASPPWSSKRLKLPSIREMQEQEMCKDDQKWLFCVRTASMAQRLPHRIRTAPQLLRATRQERHPRDCGARPAGQLSCLVGLPQRALRSCGRKSAEITQPPPRSACWLLMLRCCCRTTYWACRGEAQASQA